MTIDILEHNLQSLAMLRRFSKLGFYHVSLKLIFSQANQKFVLMLNFGCIAIVFTLIQMLR